jgi:hypothetical protein
MNTGVPPTPPIAAFLLTIYEYMFWENPRKLPIWEKELQNYFRFSYCSTMQHQVALWNQAVLFLRLGKTNSSKYSHLSPCQLLITAVSNKAAFLRPRQTDTQTDWVDNLTLMLINCIKKIYHLRFWRTISTKKFQCYRIHFDHTASPID